MKSRWLALLLPIVATSALAQLKESVTVSIVEVPVTVVSRDGAPVRGLTAANFDLWDDGKKRPISSFEAIDLAAPEMEGGANAPATAPMNPAARRNFMLLFDLSYSNPKALLRAKAAAHEFVSRSVKRRDRLAVGTFDANRGFSLVTAFTTDRGVVQQAIDNPGEFTGTDPLQITSRGPAPVPETVWAVGSESTGHQQAQVEFSNAQRELAKRSALFDDQYRSQQVDRQLEILSMISRTMHTVIGRKEIILLSEGFDPRLVQGRKAMTKEAESNQTAVEHGEIWKVNTDDSYGNSQSQSLLTQFAEMCRRSDVVLHAIDIQGLRGSSDVETGEVAASNEGLHMLANAGGGEVFKNSNDLGSSLDRMIRQQEVTYILAFRAPTALPGTFHKLKVKVVDAPPGAKVSYRTGYYEAGAGTDAERTLATAEIMVNDIPQMDLHVDALPSVFTRPGGNAAVPVVVDLNGGDLLRLKDDVILVAEVFVYAFDANGGVRDSLFQRLTIDTEKLADKLSAGGVKYLGTLSLPPGQYAIKTLVRLPELGRNGFTRNDVVVPEGDVTTMSPPLFYEDSSRWVLVKGTSHDPSGAYPFVVGETTFVPSAAARLKNGARHRFAVFVRNAARDAAVEVTPPAALVERTGDAFVFDLDAASVKSSTLDVALRGSAMKSSVAVQGP